MGNELADVAAKTAARLCHISGMGVPLSDFRVLLNFIVETYGRIIGLIYQIILS